MSTKKKPELPQVTNVPLPISENPIVIDLPAGQKLVLGKLASGTVIEVATWHGTGRPDSRTSRLMFGISSTTPQIAEQGSEKSTAGSAPESSTIDQKITPISKVKLILQKFAGKSKSSTQQANSVEEFEKKPSFREKFAMGVNTTSRKKDDFVTSEKIEEMDIEAWLDSLTSKGDKSKPAKPFKPVKKVAKKAAPAKKTANRSSNPRK